MRRIPTPAGVAAGAVVLAAALATGAQARTWDQKWSVTGTPVVHVSTNDAHVSIHAGPPGAVSAHVLYEVHQWGIGSGSKSPVLTLEQNGNEITISARSQGAWVVLGGSSEKFQIDVTLPSSTDLDVRSGDGAVDCEPVSGRVSLSAGDGHVHATGLRGQVELHTGDGSIEADRLDGSVTARTGDGALHVAGRFDALVLHTGDGRLEATAERGSQVATDWDLSTGDGSLLLRIPRNLQALLEAHTSDGRLHVDLPISVHGDVSGRNLRGQLNGGTVPLRLRTGDGSLTLGLSE